MATALTAVILILLYVLSELNYDRHFSHYQRIYRVALEVQSESRTLRSALTLAPLGRRLREEIPEVAEFATFTSHSRMGLEIDNEIFSEPSTIVVTKNFLKVFDFKLKVGDSETALTFPYSILISESRAIKYFGSTDVIGKVIHQPQWGDFKVTGVLENPSTETHFQPQVVMYLNQDHFPLDEWESRQFYNYILLQDRVEKEKVKKKLPDFYQSYLIDSFGDRGKLFLQNVADIHLYSDLDHEHRPNGSITNSYTTGALGVFHANGGFHQLYESSYYSSGKAHEGNRYPFCNGIHPPHAWKPMAN